MERIGGQNSKSVVHDAVESGVGKVLDRILDVSNGRVPTDDGELRNSGRVTQDGTSGTVSYNTEYAVVQHERQDYQHPSGGRAKFLESAIGDERGQVLQTIADEVRRNLAG